MCLKLNTAHTIRKVLHMITYHIIYALLMTAGVVIKFPLLYKNMLRFNVPVTVIITAVTSSAMELAYLPFSPLCDNAPALLFIYLLSVAVTVMLIRFDSLIDMLILDCFYQFFYNICSRLHNALRSCCGVLCHCADYLPQMHTSDSKYEYEIKAASVYGHSFTCIYIYGDKAYSQSRCLPDALRLSRCMLRNTADTYGNITPHILYKCISQDQRRKSAYAG